MNQTIKEGYCYQLLDGLLNVTTPISARKLNNLASRKGAVKVSKEDAIKRGFDELANWSVHEHDELFVIDNYILLCIPKNGSLYV